MEDDRGNHDRTTWLSKLKCNNCGNRWFEPIPKGSKIVDTPNGIVIMKDDEDITKTEGKAIANIECYVCNCKSVVTKDIERMNNYRKEKEREREEHRDDHLVSAASFRDDRDFNRRDDRDFNRGKKPFYKKF